MLIHVRPFGLSQKLSEPVHHIGFMLHKRVSIAVERYSRILVTENLGERFHIHAVLQRQRCEGMSQIMESDTLTVCPLQYGGQPLADSSGISG